MPFHSNEIRSLNREENTKCGTLDLLFLMPEVEG